MMLESVCKIYPRRLHLKGNFYDDVYIWYILKCVNMIELRYYAYLYAPSFLVLWHIIFETTAQIPEVEFEGKYGYLSENTDK